MPELSDFSPKEMLKRPSSDLDDKFNTFTDFTFTDLSPVAEWTNFSLKEASLSTTVEERFSFYPSGDTIGQTTGPLAALRQRPGPTGTQLFVPVKKKHQNYGRGKEHYQTKAIAEKRLEGRIIFRTEAYTWFLQHFPKINMQNLKKIAKTVSELINIKLDRASCRRQDLLLLWFDDNWSIIEPILPYIETNKN
ncbi:MAG: hypothetical protein LBL30_01665 [Holosporales bacterium]|nr:hypothetical protein [Holosporales bacterium]